jgi:hypothetical protein
MKEDENIGDESFLCLLIPRELSQAHKVEWKTMKIFGSFIKVIH